MKPVADFRDVMRVVDQVGVVRAERSVASPAQAREDLAQRVRAVYEEQGLDVDRETLDEALLRAGFPDGNSGAMAVVSPSDQSELLRVISPPADVFLGPGGMPLVEMLLLTGILCCLAVAAFVILPQVNASNHANRMVAEVDQMHADIEEIFRGDASGEKRFENFNVKLLHEARVLPDGLAFRGGVALNSFGGVMTAHPIPQGQYALSYTSVPSRICEWTVSHAPSMTNSLVINSRSFALPMSDSDMVRATRACKASDAATLEFVDGQDQGELALIAREVQKVRASR